jgi:hypothetical protein
MNKSRDNKLLFVANGVKIIEVFEIDDADLPPQENDLPEMLFALDTSDTDDKYLIAVSILDRSGEEDVLVYAIKKDLKTKQFELVRKFISGLDGSFFYRTIKILPNKNVVLISTNFSDEESTPTLCFKLLDGNSSNSGTVI